METALYRVVQESLTNIVKHANAHNVSVSLSRRASGVAAVIEDDGAGFDQRATREDAIGISGCASDSRFSTAGWRSSPGKVPGRRSWRRFL